MSPLTGVLTEAWELYKRYATHFLAIAFAVYLVTAVLVALLSLAGPAGVIIGSIISFAATYVVQVALVKAVQDVRDGRVDLDLGQTVRAALPYFWPVVGASILAGIAIAIGFVLLIVPGFILLTFLCLIVPWIVLGGSGVFDSFGNSWRTVRGYAWRVFGTYVLVFLILIALSIVLSIALLILPLFLRSFVNSVVSGTLVAPFLALVVTLIYYRLTAAHAAGPAAAGGPPPPSWAPPGPAPTTGESTTPYPTPGSPPPSPGSPPPSPDRGSTAPYPTMPPSSPGPDQRSPGPDQPASPPDDDSAPPEPRAP
ncbi:MAG: hypothetical protein ACM3ML_04260 [Micromonosporaceae bacterium]